MTERGKFALLASAFALAYAVPFGDDGVQRALAGGFVLVGDYARAHVLLCLVPALFIAGAIAVFVSQGAVLRYLGPSAPRAVAYGVASVSGGILAVCSCTVLPLFAGIHRRGAGLGPATSFLYSGPAINVLAIAMTAQVLGARLGLARAVGAVAFSFAIGLAMAAIFRRGEAARDPAGPDPFASSGDRDPRAGRSAALVGSMVALLVLATWQAPAGSAGVVRWVGAAKWPLAGAALAATLWIAFRRFDRDERAAWAGETWGFAKTMLPLLFAGVFVSGVLLGVPGSHDGLVPREAVARLVGGESLRANLAASLFGAVMYFATLTEVPILQGLLGQGMGEGPALALLLSGPAVSLPSLLVIRTVVGTRRTLAYAGLVVAFSTLAGWAWGALAA